MEGKLRVGGGVAVTGLPQQEASHVVTAELSNQTSAGEDVEMLTREG